MSDESGEIIKHGERAEPLDAEHSILQRIDGYRFGSDAVALAHFAAEAAGRGRDTKVFDLCSGCGIVGILLAIETDAQVDGAEIDGELYDMSVRSCAINALDRVRFFNADIRESESEVFAAARYDVVVCNPPFFKAASRARKIAPSANSELTVAFDDVARAAKKLLKPHGAFCVVHTCSRLDEIMSTCSVYGLAPKQLVVNPNGKTFLLRCIKGGKSGMTVTVKEF